MLRARVRSWTALQRSEEQQMLISGLLGISLDQYAANLDAQLEPL